MNTLFPLLVILFAAASQHAPPPPPEVPPSIPAQPNVQQPAAPVSPAPASPAPQQGGAPAANQQGVMPSIAIMPFDSSLPRYVFATGPTSAEGDCGNVERNGADLARRATAELLESMVATQRFRVVDRNTVDRLLGEQNFIRTQGVDPKELTRLGRLIGADRLIVTSLDLAGTSCTRIEVRASGYVAFEFSGGIEVAYRVLDVATGEIEHMGRLTRTWDSRQSPELKSVLSSPDGAASFFIQQAATAETLAILDAIDPIKIAAIQDGVVILNQGRGRPLAIGATLRVMVKGEPIRDPDTGAILSDEAGEAAIIQVIAVEEKLSRARVVAGDPSKIVIGASCRTLDVPSPN